MVRTQGTGTSPPTPRHTECANTPWDARIVPPNIREAPPRASAFEEVAGKQITDHVQPHFGGGVEAAARVTAHGPTDCGAGASNAADDDVGDRGMAPSAASQDSTAAVVPNQEASSTVLEASLVEDGEPAEVAAYLGTMEAPSLATPEWLARGVAPQVPKMMAWWRCAADALSDSAAAKQLRRQGLQVMLQAAVQATSKEDLASVVARLREWASDWRDRDGKVSAALAA